jgi:hypothetical protein
MPEGTECVHRDGCEGRDGSAAKAGEGRTALQRRRAKVGRLRSEARRRKGPNGSDGTATARQVLRKGGSHGANHGDFKRLDLPHF